jgi:hypothetical protein
MIPASASSSRAATSFAIFSRAFSSAAAAFSSAVTSLACQSPTITPDPVRSFELGFIPLSLSLFQ